MPSFESVNHARQVWQEVLAYLRQCQSALVRAWFDSLSPESLEGGTLTVRAQTPIQQHYLVTKCREVFNEAAQAATGNLLTVNFVCDGAAGGDLLRFGDNFDEVILSPDYVYDNFVKGPCNDMAWTTSQAVCERPGIAYNPLFIHGSCGLGKTHLLQATCQELLRRDPQRRILYLSCDTFRNHFMESVRNNQMAEFRHRYRGVDVLVIDDIHFLAKWDRTQEEFFHTFNALFQRNKQIILSSDCPPWEIPALEDRLISRFGSGMVAQVDKPDFETRVAIVAMKARLRGTPLPQDVVEYIARKIDTNIRELEGALTRVQGYAMLHGGRYDLTLARAALGDVHTNVRRTLTMQEIADLVAGYYKVRLSDLQGKRRLRSVAYPRQVTMYLARHFTDYSLTEIGAYLGGRDHTTIIHGVRAVDNDRSTNSKVDAEVARLEQMLKDSTRAAAG